MMAIYFWRLIIYTTLQLFSKSLYTNSTLFLKCTYLFWIDCDISSTWGDSRHWKPALFINRYNWTIWYIYVNCWDDSWDRKHMAGWLCVSSIVKSNIGLDHSHRNMMMIFVYILGPFVFEWNCFFLQISPISKNN